MILCLTQGRFQSVSEVIRAGLTKLEEHETKLQVLKDKLQAGEDSSLIEQFSAKKFIAELHNKHLK